MKRKALWIVSVGVLGSVALLTAGQGFAIEIDGSPKCSVATLKGRYLFAAQGWVFGPDQTEPAVAASVAGIHVFNGDRTGYDLVTLTLNGVVQQVPHVNPLTYELNSDCTGTYAVTGTPLTFAVFVSPNGDEITTINTNAGASSSYPPSRRVIALEHYANPRARLKVTKGIDRIGNSRSNWSDRSTGPI